MKSDVITEKDLFYSTLKYGQLILGHIQNSVASRTAMFEALVNHGVLGDLDCKNKDAEPIYQINKDFRYTENRHGDERCALHFRKGDQLVVDRQKRFWI